VLSGTLVIGYTKSLAQDSVWRSSAYFLCEELMKLFQQLLVAPAALGLLASGANAA
jgi:hypothetical protein